MFVRESKFPWAMWGGELGLGLWEAHNVIGKPLSPVRESGFSIFQAIIPVVYGCMCNMQPGILTEKERCTHPYIFTIIIFTRSGSHEQ